MATVALVVRAVLVLLPKVETVALLVRQVRQEAEVLAAMAEAAVRLAVST